MRCNPVTYWLNRVRDYGKEPIPAKHNIRDLCFIWLYISALNTEHDMEWPIVQENDWLTLSEYIENNYFLVDAKMSDAIPKDLLTWRTPWGIDWSIGIPMVVVNYVNSYVKIIKGRNIGQAT